MEDIPESPLFPFLWPPKPSPPPQALPPFPAAVSRSTPNTGENSSPARFQEALKGSSHDGVAAGALPRIAAAADRISALPDNVLLQVLLRLRCTRASVLSRRWRGLWAHLSELSFRNVRPDAADSALAQVALARPALSVLGVHIPERHMFDAARVTSLLRAAAWLPPAELAFAVRGGRQGCGITVELPCFDRANSIKLEMRSLMLATPVPAGEFRALERLSAGCLFDPVAMLPLCPHLHVLEMRDCWGLGAVTIHSASLEELVWMGKARLRRIDSVAPLLK